MICLTGVAQSFIFDSPKRQVCLGPSHHSLALFARRSRCFDIVSIRVKGEVSEVMPSVFLFGYQCRVDMLHRVIKKSSLTSVVSASEELGSLSRECEVPGEVNSGLPYSQSFFSQSKCHSQFPARKSRTVAAMSSSQAKA